MRTLVAALTCVAIFPASIGQPRRRPATLLANTVTVREVRHALEIGSTTDLGGSPPALVVERPSGARPGATVGVFVVSDDGELLRRVVVTYGRASGPLIQIVDGASPGDRVVVSDMSEWDRFDRLQLRW
jgi:hypothetical protein